MFGFRKKQCPKNFAFLILEILELFTRELYIFLEKKATFLIYFIVSVFL